MIDSSNYAKSQFYPEAKAVKGYQSMQLLHLRLQFLMYAPQYGCESLSYAAKMSADSARQLCGWSLAKRCARRSILGYTAKITSICMRICRTHWSET